MSNIHYLKTYKSDPNNRSMVTDELIDKLYDFAPRNVFYWVLKFAKIRFNQRIKQDAETWFDKLRVYVGLPDWVITESQIEDDNVAHVKVPFGLINDINDISDIGLQISIPYQREDSETGELYNTLHHVTADFFALRSYHMDSDIINQKEEFADMEDQFDDLIENGVANVWRKKQLLVKRLRTENFHIERTEILYTCLNTCMGLADGNIELIEEFTDIEDAGQIGSDEAQKIYSSLTVEEFFDWSTEHFGLDDYYSDTEVLIDNVKYHMEDDERMLEFNEPYKFITKMIARTFPIIEHN
ncbi:hypothetical protein N9767_02250 [Planktomarina temperata]|nr:hypothetical protein [bacterium]MDB4203182.1 hypothetical protein [Planktomarina temperata]